MGHKFSKSALLTLTFLTQYLLEGNPYFCVLLLKGKKKILNNIPIVYISYIVQKRAKQISINVKFLSGSLLQSDSLMEM